MAQERGGAHRPAPGAWLFAQTSTPPPWPSASSPPSPAASGRQCAQRRQWLPGAGLPRGLRRHEPAGDVPVLGAPARDASRLARGVQAPDARHLEKRISGMDGSKGLWPELFSHSHSAMRAAWLDLVPAAPPPFCACLSGGAASFTLAATAASKLHSQRGRRCSRPPERRRRGLAPDACVSPAPHLSGAEHSLAPCRS